MSCTPTSGAYRSENLRRQGRRPGVKAGTEGSGGNAWASRFGKERWTEKCSFSSAARFQLRIRVFVFSASGRTESLADNGETCDSEGNENSRLNFGSKLRV
jgi:hypothetical protein